MREQITTTEATAKTLSQILGQEIPVGTVLTITAPKNQIGRECACGCKGTTSGGLWVPGHDAKHKSRLFHLVRGTDVAQVAAAKAELEKRGWGLPSSSRTTHVEPLPLPTSK